jgi:hypothetical protein
VGFVDMRPLRNFSEFFVGVVQRGRGAWPLSQQRPLTLKVCRGVDVCIRLGIWMRHLWFSSLH